MHMKSFQYMIQKCIIHHSSAIWESTFPKMIESKPFIFQKPQWNSNGSGEFNNIHTHLSIKYKRLNFIPEKLISRGTATTRVSPPTYLRFPSTALGKIFPPWLHKNLTLLLGEFKDDNASSPPPSDILFYFFVTQSNQILIIKSKKKDYFFKFLIKRGWNDAFSDSDE